MDKKKIKAIKELIRKMAADDDWKYHLAPMTSYAKKLAKTLGADQNLTELAAWLHDVGRLKTGDRENHHLTGAPIAEKILKKYQFDQKVIKEVKHCIQSHRSKKGVKPKTLVAKIIANADAMAHFDILPVFFYWRSKKQNFEEAFSWVEHKIEKNWKKLTLPVARNLVRKKYQAIKLILRSNRKLMGEE